MRVAVVGAGALGLYYGAKLQRSGVDVRFLLRRDYDAVLKKGLTVRSVDGDFFLPKVAASRTPEEIGPVDLILVGLKTFDNSQYKALIDPLLEEKTRILTLQNGLGNEEALAELFGRDRVLGGVAFLCSNRREPGEVLHLGEGRITLGALDAGNEPFAQEVAALFDRAGVPCRAVSDLKRARWEKLVWNIPFNGMCALTLQPVDVVLASPRCRRLVRAIMDEVVAAANAQGLQQDIAADFTAKMIELTEPMGSYSPSMLIDRQLGRPVELNAIFSAPILAGASRHVSMPHTEDLYALLAVSVRDRSA